MPFKPHAPHILGPDTSPPSRPGKATPHCLFLVVLHAPSPACPGATPPPPLPAPTPLGACTACRADEADLLPPVSQTLTASARLPSSAHEPAWKGQSPGEGAGAACQSPHEVAQA